MSYPERDTQPLESQTFLSVPTWRTENLKHELHEPIKKTMKDNVLNSATESSCHHKFLEYLAKHL